MASYEGLKNHMWSQDIMAVSAVRKEPLGIIRILDDGRKYRYARNGAVALIGGYAVQSLACTANHINLVLPANVSVGSTKLTVTLGNTAATLNYYEGGLLQVNSGAGAIGNQYKIRGNKAADALGACEIYLDVPVVIALTAGVHRVSLIPNQYKDLVMNAAAASPCVGIAPRAVPIANYFWVQTGGRCSAETDAAPAVGSMLVAGANGELYVATDFLSPFVGHVVGTAGVADETKPVMLTID